MDVDIFSEQIELATIAPWDPMYGSTEPGLFPAHTCRKCGALVDAAALDTHTAFHEGHH